jgi:hypothetical protein
MKTAVVESIPASRWRCLRAPVFTAIGVGLALALAFARGAVAQQNSLTAIDIALEPDATMLQHARDANARLLNSFPKGFALDETHHPHVTMLQQFVRTDDDPNRGGPHSITSSARARSVVGIVMPSALAVLRLITSSNRLGCSIGRSEARAPLRMRST